MVHQGDPEKATAEFIEKFVSDYWNRQGSACYLSTIGFNVKREVPESVSVLSLGLMNFLRQNPIVQVVQFPGVDQKVGAVPLSVVLPEDIKELFQQNDPKLAPKPSVVYVQEFWDAFIEPIVGEPRFVCVGKDGSVHIAAKSTGKSNDACYEILEEDLTKIPMGGSIADRVASTHKAIEAWLEKNRLEARVFSTHARRRPDTVIGGHLGDFLAAFGGLSFEDLARIHIPMDILVKLNSKKQ